MKNHIFIFLFVVCPLVGWTQVIQQDSVKSNLASIDSIQISKKINDRIKMLSDSINGIDTVKTVNPLNGKFSRIKSKKDSLEAIPSSLADSIKLLTLADSVSARLKNLSRAGVDSISDKLISLKAKIPTRPDSSLSTEKFTAPISKTQDTINKKLGLFNENGAENVKSIPSLPKNPLTAGTNTGANIGLPSPSIKGTPDINMPDVGSLGIANSTPEIGNALPSVDIPTAPGVGNLGNDQVGGIADKVSALKEHQDQIEGINSDQLKQLSDENAGNLEERLMGFDDMEAVKQQIDLADQMKRFYDPEVAKEEALNKAKQQAVNHFAGHENELKAAMEKLSALKAKFPDAEGALDLFAKRQRPLQNLSILQRLNAGISLQFQKQGSFWLDLNPNVAYRMSARLTGGLGWNERLAYSFKDRCWDRQYHIYGPRIFAHFKVKSNFSFQAEIEAMRSPVRATQLLTSDIIGRAWVFTYFGGIRRDFQISKSLKGNVQMLYNIYNAEKRSPYINRFNVRIGIDIPLKQQRNKKATTVNDSSSEK